MSLSFSTQSTPSALEISNRLTDFVHAFENTSEDKIKIAEQNIDLFFSYIEATMEDQGIVPLDIKTWLDQEGKIAAFVLETRSLIKGSFRNASGNFEEMKRAQGNPMDKVQSDFQTSEPDIEVAIRGEDTALRTKRFPENSQENLLCLSLLAMFLTAEIRSLSNNRRVIGNVQKESENKASIKHTYTTAQTILESIVL